MTYCVGIKVNEGLAFASDSRTNAGVDRVSIFRKMFVFDRPGDRLFVLLTAGNLSVGPPIDVLLYRTDALAIGYRASLEADDPYLSALGEKWSQSLNRAFRSVEEPDWPI